jgi:hypothetical protein
MIKTEIEKILSEINNRAELVIAVKYANLDQIQEVISIHPNIAFNTYQQFKEISEKINLENIKTHLIGNIQSNKIKKILELKPFLIQSVDSLENAIKINEQAEKLNLTQNILLQINSDKNKLFGFRLENLENELKKIYSLKNLNLLGIMTIPPQKELIGEEKLIEIYKNMKTLFDKLKQSNLQIKYLSMGMSEDYLLAIEKGANMVRVGRKILPDF